MKIWSATQIKASAERESIDVIGQTAARLIDRGGDGYFDVLLEYI